jgi:hypothetical protein
MLRSLLDKAQKKAEVGSRLEHSPTKVASQIKFPPDHQALAITVLFVRDVRGYDNKGIQNIFERFSPVIDCSIPTNKNCCFITLLASQATLALEWFNKRTELSVSLANDQRHVDPGVYIREKRVCRSHLIGSCCATPCIFNLPHSSFEEGYDYEKTLKKQQKRNWRNGSLITSSLTVAGKRSSSVLYPDATVTTQDVLAVVSPLCSNSDITVDEEKMNPAQQRPNKLQRQNVTNVSTAPLHDIGKYCA